MGCFSGSNPLPQPVNYAGVISSTLGAQSNLAPEQFAAESSPEFGQPAYANLSLESLNNLLYGGPASTEKVNFNDVQQSTGGWYNDLTGAFVGGNEGANPGNARWEPSGTIFNTPVTETINTPATTGVIPNTQALLMSDPALNSILGNVTNTANTNLSYGDTLTPDQSRMINQQSLADFASRGMSGSGSSVVDAILRQLNYGQQLLTQRQQAAGQATQLQQNAYLNPLVGVVGNLLGGAKSGGPNLFNPQAGLPIAQSDYNTQAQAAAAAPTGLQQTGQALSAVSSILGML